MKLIPSAYDVSAADAFYQPDVEEQTLGGVRTRASVAVIVLVTFIIWMGSRATAIALPLVALDQTGDTWATGLVLGAQSLPLLTVGWWGAKLRERITTGRAVAAVMAVKVAGLAIVPTAAAFHRVDVLALVGDGLVVGATSALDAPGVRSLLSDFGDQIGPGHAARALTLQDLAHRSTMFLAPPLGALAVGHGQTIALLWSQCVAVTVGAMLMALLPRPAQARRSAATADVGSEPSAARPDLIATLKSYPRMRASIIVHAVVSLTWFAFSLGLAIAGAQDHRPGELIAAGMSGYGLASTLTSLAAPALVNRARPWPTAVLPIIVLGVCFLALPSQLTSLTSITLLAAAGGVCMPLGIGAHNRILATDPPSGPPRRAAFAADQIADGGASALGMLLGGAVIGLVGTTTTFYAAGTLQIAVAIVAIATRPPTTRPCPFAAGTNKY